MTFKVKYNILCSELIAPGHSSCRRKRDTFLPCHTSTYSMGSSPDSRITRANVLILSVPHWLTPLKFSLEEAGKWMSRRQRFEPTDTKINGLRDTVRPRVMFLCKISCLGTIAFLARQHHSVTVSDETLRLKTSSSIESFDICERKSRTKSGPGRAVWLKAAINRIKWAFVGCPEDSSHRGGPFWWLRANSEHALCK